LDVEKSHINKIVKKLELENLLELRMTIYGGLSEKKIDLTEKDNEIAKFALKNMSYLKREILKKHPLADFKNFISYMNLLS
jgi:DNA-binding MarR family transcriptional regulator